MLFLDFKAVQIVAEHGLHTLHQLHKGFNFRVIHVNLVQISLALRVVLHHHQKLVDVVLVPDDLLEVIIAAEE